ncbi:MAG: hypothetical protein IJQ21_03560 [Lachnospiraceae bacterium]|nr:hypothetical protein [Lachnospiraceae bacterium]
MKNRNNYLLLILLVISSLILAVLGFVGRTGAYAAYDFQPEKDVLISLPLKGISDGIGPVSVLTAPQAEPAEPADTGVSVPVRDEAAGGETRDDIPPEEAPAEEAPTEEVPAEEPPAEEPVAEQVPPEESLPEERPVPEDAAADSLTTDIPDPATGAPADDAYYADALFIGDSRTVGLSQYVPGLDQYATFYSAVSLSVFNAMSAPIANVDGVMVSVDQALQVKQFNKIYIMVGINEIGYARDAWLAAYFDVIARIRELQPAATIYIQSIMHVSSAKEAAQPVFNNPEINARNEGLRTLANGDDIIYMDINYLLDDVNGALNAELTFDGVHLTAGAYDLWYQEIKAQTR